ncbi:MAG: hypothetical protein ABJA50_06390 [Chloroflexota bacterium]
MGQSKLVSSHRQVLRRMLSLRQPQSLDVAVSGEQLANYRPSRR